MDEYLSEKEQIEQIRQWWSEYGWYLLGGAVLALAGMFGFRQYNAHQERTIEAQSAIYQELRQALEDDDRQIADVLLNQLATDHAGSAYLDQARMFIAEENLIRDTPRAISELQSVVDETQDDSLAILARLRLARVLAYDEQYERALDTLSVADAGQFKPQYSEVRGDIYAATGDVDAAVSAYTEALLGSGNGGVNTDIVQLKLSDLWERESPEIEDEG